MKASAQIHADETSLPPPLSPQKGPYPFAEGEL